MRVNRRRILILIAVLLLGSSAFYFANQSQTLKPAAKEPATTAPEAWAQPDPTPNQDDTYKDQLAKLETERVALTSRYQQAASATQRTEIIAEARTLITRSIYAGIFPSWYGTPWDFNGTTESPRQGKIACGYFVSTVLQDAGWKVQRVRLAQQASEKIILSLTTEAHVKRFRRVAINDFVDAVKKWGTGIYVVGLDIHTGFIVHTGAEVYFIHSSYVEPYAVVREKASESKILGTSNYRVLGKITADDRFIEKWLLKTEILTQTT